MRTGLKCVSASLYYTDDDNGSLSRAASAIETILARAESAGRAKSAEYTCEGDDRQCRENPPCTLYVAALTPAQYRRIMALAGRADDADVRDIERDQDADTPSWDGAIYYCGQACDLPVFQD